MRVLFQSYQFMQINPDHFIFQIPLMRTGSFNRINSCRSIPTTMYGNTILNPSTMFQSYQFMQINPDGYNTVSSFEYVLGFNRINSCRSIPTRIYELSHSYSMYLVSIVSIHADQSRLQIIYLNYVARHGFNRINSCRSIPTQHRSS